MNTKNLKAYAPKARSQFIEAIKKRAAQFGIYEGENGEARIETVQIEGSVAIIEGRAFTRQEGEQRKRLEKKVVERGFDMFIREMAYTWFNRFAAIRYMELHGYFDHGFRVLSPANSHPSSVDSLPEILSHASDVADGLKLNKSHIIELQLAGDKEEQLYRELLLGQCHQLANIMPFVFKGLTADSIDDAAELLLPDNLTKTDSILKGLITDIPEEDWNDIEVIGWLYQFYISEHKDAVIGKVVKSEDIPAATQLFTPNWIVKYLVQNSLGRQWLATYPESELKGKMEYYIQPAEQSEEVIEQLKVITPTSINPEEIKVLDPAAGSGHILVEVYEVLREIYLERGYRLREIPELILTKNIYGLDIDDRAAQLAGFALMMKAREDDRRIFQRVEDGEVALNVYSLQSTESLDIGKLWQALNLEGNQKQGSTGGLFDSSGDLVELTGIYKDYFELLQTLKSVFLQAKVLGSLIQIDNCHLQNLVALKELLQIKEKGSDPSAKQAATNLLPVVNQAIALAQQYDVVVANPPYMGSNGMNAELKGFARNQYPVSKYDLFAIYIQRTMKFGHRHAEVSLVTPFVWMFISSYEGLRKELLANATLSSLVQLEYNAFEPACIPVCAYSFRNDHVADFKSTFIKLSEFKGHRNQAPKTIEAIRNRKSSWLYESSPDSFLDIPGYPIAFWATEKTIDMLSKGNNVGSKYPVKSGIMTGDDSQFLRHWHEVPLNKIGQNLIDSSEMESKWYPLSKGGSYRKWYGNVEHVINLENDADAIKTGGKNYRLREKSLYFKNYITWSRISSGQISFRYLKNGTLFADAAPGIFAEDKCYEILGVLNSKVGNYCLNLLNPTLNYQTFDVERLPVLEPGASEIIENCISISKKDWDSFETSLTFQMNPIIEVKSSTVEEAFQNYLQSSINSFKDLKRHEESLNKVYVSEFNLEDTIDHIISDEDISLKRNPAYRYGVKEGSQGDRFTSDTFVELLSSSIGYMMGRYSLDREGLVYAHSGNEGFKELVAEGAYQIFPADDDGIVPLASEEWLFDDDATARFREFVKIVWGEVNLQKNLEFVAKSLCLHALKPTNNESANDTVRRYFSKQFYKDHCQTYKKRPIYWLFSSGKEKAFECLVYLHRYNEGTLSRMRTEYVTPLMGKFDAQHTLLSEQQIQASGTEARRIEKELKTLDKKQAELRTFDEQLKHYAEKRITLDLDDGVKANYGKFGNLLADVKAIHGKAVK